METKVIKNVEIGRAPLGSALPRAFGPRSLRPHAAPHNDVLYNYLDNPDIQKLLDVVSSIIADEYVEIAKRNPDVFKNGGEK